MLWKIKAKISETYYNRNEFYYNGTGIIIKAAASTMLRPLIVGLQKEMVEISVTLSKKV